MRSDEIGEIMRCHQGRSGEIIMGDHHGISAEIRGDQGRLERGGDQGEIKGDRGRSGGRTLDALLLLLLRIDLLLLELLKRDRVVGGRRGGARTRVGVGDGRRRHRRGGGRRGLHIEGGGEGGEGVGDHRLEEIEGEQRRLFRQCRCRLATRLALLALLALLAFLAGRRRRRRERVAHLRMHALGTAR